MAIETVGVKYVADLSELEKQFQELIALNLKLMKSVDASGHEIEQSQDKAAKSTDNLNKELTQEATAIKKVSTQTQQLKKEGGQLEGAFKKVGAVFATAFAVDRIISFGRQMLEVTARFQKFEAVLTNTLGSNSKAQDALRMITKFASTTPFQVSELTESFVKLANQGFLPTEKEMRKLGDLAASTGKSFDMLTEAIIDAQTGEFERLKEFGIRASKEGDNVSFTFKGVKTQVDFTNTAIRDYILSLGELEGVQGSTAAISETLGGKISNLQDSWEMLLNNLGSNSSGVFSDIIDLLNRAIQAVDNFFESLETHNDEVKTFFKDQREELDKVRNSLSEQTNEQITETERLIKTNLAAANAALKKAREEGDKDAEKAASADKRRLIDELTNFQKIQMEGQEARDKAAEAQTEQQALLRKKQAEHSKELLAKEFEYMELVIQNMNDGTDKLIAAENLAFKKRRAALGDNYKAIGQLEIQHQANVDKILQDAADARIKKIEQPDEINSIKSNADIQIGIQKNAQKNIQDTTDAFKKGVESNEDAREQDLKNQQRTEEERIQLRQATNQSLTALAVIFAGEQQNIANFQKALTLFQIGIDTAKAISSGIASASTVPFPGNILAIATTVATVLTNIATAKSLVDSSQVPAFATGVIDLKGAGTATSDSIPARLSKGESVMTAAETARYKPELTAMRDGTFQDMITTNYLRPYLEDYDRYQKAAFADQVAYAMKLQNSGFDDSQIVYGLSKIKPATAKDIDRLGKTIVSGNKILTYKHSKGWVRND